MSVWEAFVLGLVQGLAEFLPISSSGHLALLQHFFGIEGERILTFTILLHAGTLVAVFVAYRAIIWALVKELGALIKDLLTGRGLRPNANENRKLGLMILVASIPAAIVGILFDDYEERFFTSVTVIGVCLIVTGSILFAAERAGSGKRTLERANFRNAFAVGVFQAVALLPGISRSGSTVVGGLFLGFTRELAVQFAFLISIPSVLGAVILEAPDALKSGLAGEMMLPAAVGVSVAAVAGYAAIKAMIRIVTGKKLFVFSVYTWILGAFVVIYTIIR
ncbi:MAG: undecaprenyl-diphosphate phosphatase [Clostridiales Family XIII bacterium]|jgi:undecaprenyl-diphosphatase|nr:undecaprenyl-diphosphate phosphatase [Clostridiales Family XIII bacterium]